MSRTEGFKIIKRAQLTAMMNQRYHSSLRGFFAILDKLIRIVVGILAVASAALAMSPSMNQSQTAISIAMFSAGMAIVLNILPVGEWEKSHLDLFRRWSGLRKRWESLELQIVKSELDKSIGSAMIDDFDSLNGEKIAIEGDEPRRINWLWRRAETAIRNRAYGDGTGQQYIEKELKRKFGDPFAEANQPQSEAVAAT